MNNDNKLMHSDLAMESRRLRKEEEDDLTKKIMDSDLLDGEEEVELPQKTMRDTFYGRINVSVKTMDKVIVGLFIALAAAIILGVIIK